MPSITRNTGETRIALSLSHPSPSGSSHIDIPCGFLAHMLDLMAHRGRFRLDLEATGDVCVDAHHLTEDVGITAGMALREMIVSEGIPRRRYGWCLLPMDGSLARVALDISGRGGLYWEGNFPTERCGNFDLELVPEFFRGFCRESRATLHISLLAADNSHHAAEAVFKGVGIALDMALQQAEAEPSTKGAWI
ncbi:MAG: imidazoleglycerol-phosphate dehydratase [Synergistaceae bacterium]|jgi:imidazoleglycerol-phosphate dehydratase|nr:imidazoleglycerol-phosphate dehydratase [Synergistaceae bacterium]